jgi:hypothetical protein
MMPHKFRAVCKLLDQHLQELAVSAHQLLPIKEGDKPQLLTAWV